jgi:OPT family oligopeptide transporter
MAQTVPADIAQKPYREITTASLVLGTVVGIALTVSFTYAGLKLGFTVPASMVGAMLGLGVLRVVMKRGSIVENNINQTVAAAINVSSAGVIFTVPVLYLMQTEAASKSAEVAAQAKIAGITIDEWLRAHPSSVQLLDMKTLLALAGASVAGSLLGVLFIVPSRKQMIELERLVFPSGVATATILKATGAGPTRFRWLMTGIGISVVFAMLTSLQTLFPHWHAPEWYQHYSEDLNFGKLVGIPAHTAVIFAVAGGLTSIGGGYITGRAGLVLMVGAIIGHWIVTPLVVTQGWMPQEIVSSLTARAAKAVAGAEGAALKESFNGYAAGWAYKQVTRPLGIGMLLGGSIASVILTAPMLISAIKSIQKARQVAGSGAGAMGAQELSPKLLYVGTVVSFLILATSGFLAGGNVSPIRIVLAAIVATIWMWLANIIVSIATGKTDNSPLSGMAILTLVLIVSIVGKDGAMIALMMAVSVCVATGQGSDMMQDLKTGHLVGAIPRRQQITQLAVSWIGPLVSLVTLVILSKKFIFGNDPLTAPQGQAVKAALEVFVPPPGTDPMQQTIAATIPWRYAAGTVTGLLLTLGGGGGLGVVLGLAMYLPMAVTLTYCTGCAIAWVTEKMKGPSWVEDVGVPLAAGFLVGEGLAQVCVVFYDLLRSAV